MSGSRKVSVGERPERVGRCRGRGAVWASVWMTLFRGEPKLQVPHSPLPISHPGMLRTQLASTRAAARRLYSSRGMSLNTVLQSFAHNASKQLHSHCLSLPGQRHGVPHTLLTPRSSRNMASTLVGFLTCQVVYCVADPIV